jgi:site-specific DNA-methyltransferase (adenine-specific)
MPNKQCPRGDALFQSFEALGPLAAEGRSRPPYYDRAGLVLFSGDALAVLPELPDASVDAVITDPPYSSGGQFRGDRAALTSVKYAERNARHPYPEFMGDTRDQRGYLHWAALWLSQCLRIAKPGAPLCVFSDWRQLPLMTDATQAGGWVWRGVVPWNKTEAVRPQLGRFRAQCEYVVWGSAGAMGGGDRRVLPGFYEAQVRKSDKHHIAGKPTKIMRDIVQICPPGGVVLDPFAGSGTTCLAASLEGRRAIGVELSAEYLAIAAKRFDNERAQAELGLGDE